jgi:hypothetical protein
MLAAGCGTEERPPTLGGGSFDAGVRTDAGPPAFVDAGAHEPTCSVGVEGGVCACTDEPLLGDAPTLYFVLDHSGSMNDSNKWATIQFTLEKVWIELGPRVRVAAAVFPDLSSVACAPGRQVFPASGPPVRGDVPSGTPGPNETALATALSTISARGGTPTAATLSALAPSIEAIGGKTYVILATDGGPNCDAAAECDASSCTDNIDEIPGCPAGGPPNCCTPSSGGPLDCLDADPTIAAVTALAAAGVPVYVVGVPGSEPYANLLDALAVAGETARGDEPRYYAVASADQTAFEAALSAIAAQVAGTCTFTLDNAPSNSLLVNVFLDGTPLPQAGPDGWTLEGDVVTVLGASCQAILDGNVIDVRVVAGCPTVEH